MDKNSRYNLLPMIGAGKCTLCRSEGTNMSTCPLNPAAHGGNPNKHPLAMVANNIVPHAIEKNTLTQIVSKKANIVLQQHSLSQTTASDQLRQLPVVETIILNMYNMDDVNSFCSSTKEIQKTCNKLFNKPAIKQEIKKENATANYGLRLPLSEEDTIIKSHIKSLMKITNPEGLYLLKLLRTTFTAQSMNEAFKHIEGQDKAETYTYKELQVPLAFKKSIKVIMLRTLANSELNLLERMTLAIDNSYIRVIEASNGMYVSVGDVLEAFFQNNQEMYKRAQKETGEEYPSLGNRDFARLYEIRPGVYNMTLEIPDFLF